MCKQNHGTQQVHSNFIVDSFRHRYGFATIVTGSAWWSINHCPYNIAFVALQLKRTVANVPVFSFSGSLSHKLAWVAVNAKVLLVPLMHLRMLWQNRKRNDLKRRMIYRCSLQEKASHTFHAKKTILSWYGKARHGAKHMMHTLKIHHRCPSIIVYCCCSSTVCVHCAMCMRFMEHFSCWYCNP